jgi:hypothetical protein
MMAGGGFTVPDSTVAKSLKQIRWKLSLNLQFDMGSSAKESQLVHLSLQKFAIETCIEIFSRKVPQAKMDYLKEITALTIRR